MEDEEYKKLPLDERCVHKLWKARVSGYEELAKLFRQLDDDKAPEFGKYLGLVKKFVTDSNAMGQEKGIEATLAYVENYAHAGKTVNEVMSGVVAKCIAAPKTRTRELAMQLTLMYIEIEKYEAVEEELIKGMELKNPKIVAACINACTTALREFGSKVITLKPLVKKISPLFGDRDKGVRDEARLMVIEMFRWIGPALRSQLSGLQPVQVSELEAEFAKIEGQKAVPTRYIRSQQQKQARLAAETAEADGDEDEEEGDEGAPAVDPYDLADPVDILSKMPKDFYEKIEAKKWQERKEVLEVVENLVKTPRLENGDYGDLVRALKKVIQKDSNVLVVALACKCVSGLASGLKKRFQTYAGAVVPALLEKFKEKKQNVVTALRDAVDAVYLTTTFEAVLEDVVEALNSKNPSVKSETASFLARSFTKTLPTALNKKLLKAITAALIKNINEPDPTVRDFAAEALGTLMKLVGEKAIGSFLVELEKDNLKMTKIRECCEKAVITVKVTGVKKERPTTAPSKAAGGDVPRGGSAAKGAKRPTIAPAPKKKPPAEANSGTSIKSKPSRTLKPTPSSTQKEKEMSEEEALEALSNIIDLEVLSGLADNNWKNRLTSVEQFLSALQGSNPAEIPTQAALKILNRKPGLKDTNFQVAKARLEVVKHLAEKSVFRIACVDCVVGDVTERLGDAKNGAAAAEVLTAMAEATDLGHVSVAVMDFAASQKSPRVFQESLLWLSNAVREFGFEKRNAKALIENSKKALASTNPGVRQAAIAFLGTLYLYMGHTLNAFFDNEKSSLRDLINAEFDKYENKKPPVPVRGVAKSASANSLDRDEEEDSSSSNVPQDLAPRVDISNQITEALINELSDKNWKVRNEALMKIQAILSEAKLIKPNVGDLAQALAPRLVDSNSKIAQTAMGLCETIATAMGPPCKQHIRTLFPGLLQGLGDTKTWVRSASLGAINALGDQCAYKEFFEAEMIADALKTGSPVLRSELWTWLAEKLPKLKSVPREELMICIPHLYSNLEDRNADVRKNAQEAVLGVMMHTSYETMAKQTEKLKPGSKSVVMAALDKARPNLPVKPLPKKAAAAEKEEKAVRGTKAAANSKNAVKKPAATSAKQTSRKKDEDIDTSPLLLVNTAKHQRNLDESKLKVLKWNFTTPREEFVELLKEQMSNANVNKNLIANMFHSDFRYHIKALESLAEDLPENGEALMANLDLILKWLTLRFFDTNPSVLLKGLEYLHSVFNMLIENQYHLIENEAASFIPYLILKIGDPKDSVRNGVRSLLKQICNVYPVSKLFMYIMEGLKSKNARQRAECLEVMGSIIEDYGINVCLPSPAACLKEVAKQISDRDNAVRNAALNCVVQAYYIVGDKVFKMVGQISDKDMSLLEERIKRASKRPPPPKKVEPVGSPQRETVASPEKVSSSQPEQLEEEDVMEEEEEDNIPQIQVSRDADRYLNNTYACNIFRVPSSAMVQEKAADDFKLDPDLMLQLDNISANVNKLQLKEFNLDFLQEKLTMPSVVGTNVTPISPPKPIVPKQTFTRRTVDKPLIAALGDEVLLQRIMREMTSSDLHTAIKALHQMQETLQGSKALLMLEYEAQFMTAITAQLQLLHPKDPRANSNVCRAYRGVLTVLDAFYNHKNLGQKVPVDVLKSILFELIRLLVDAKLEACPNGDSYIRVVNLHCVKLIEKSDHTNVICALVKLLHECVGTEASPRLVDLVMKCLWRIIKIMPTWGDGLDYDSILYELHIFLKDYPTAWWKSKPSDTPLRTVKTTLHSITKIKGATIMSHLGKIPVTNESEVENYILRLLKSLKLEEAKPAAPSQPRRALSRANHAQLTDIFQKIGNKDETKEGLTLLYDFMQQHPEADIEPFLTRSSPFFQEYIKKGLKEIEESRKKSSGDKIKEKVLEAAMGTENTRLVEISNDSDDSRGVDYWRDRLNMWNKLWDDTKNRTGTN